MSAGLGEWVLRAGLLVVTVGPLALRINGWPWPRVGRLLVGVIALKVVVLSISGVVLFFEYRPGPMAWRSVHQVTAVLVVWSVVVLGALLLFLSARRVVPGLTTVATAVGLVFTVGTAMFTGYLLPWDQVALRPVASGTDLDGFEFFFDDDTYFVLIGGTQVSPTTVLAWLGVHALVVTPAFLLILARALRRFPLRSAGAIRSIDSEPATQAPRPTSSYRDLG